MAQPADHGYMARALTLAAYGRYTAASNPMVGCVIVNQGQIVGEGFHVRPGEPHAEVHALAAAAARARGATAYVTLEPCAHYGRTGPCAEALIEAGVARVVSAVEDPNPLVAGRGHARLREAGIEVEVGVDGGAAERLNCGFFSRMRRSRPWVQLKAAISLDGRTALADGRSQWISGEASRLAVQWQRAQAGAILTGSGTVIADDPRLTVRLPVDDLPEAIAARIAACDALGRAPYCGVQPMRVVLDRRGRVPASARVLETAVAPPATIERQRNPELLLRELAAQGVNRVLVEAGAELNGALLDADLIDELTIYVAPLLIGQHGRPFSTGADLADLASAARFELLGCERFGDDVRLSFLRST